MNFGGLSLFSRLHIWVVFVLVMSLSLPAHSASFVLGKQYLLKPKRSLSSLIWYAVTFDKSITGGLKVSLKVYSEKGKSLEYLDDYRDYVAPEIAQRCVSKFSLTEYRMNFNEQKKSELGFQVNSIGDIIYLPLKVNYEDGFEDYLVRIRIKGGKFAISTRPLQHGMLTKPAENAVENFRAEKAKEKEKKKKQEEAKKAKAEADQKKAEEDAARKLKEEQEKAIKNSPAIMVNDELFNPESEDVDNLLKESESEFKAKEKEAQSLIKSDDDLYKEPLQVDPKLQVPTETKPEVTPESAIEDESVDAIFKDGGAASENPAPQEPVESSNLNPFGDEFPEDSAPKSKAKDKADSKKEAAKPSASEDDEIEIEGFDKALEELERLEGLEGL